MKYTNIRRRQQSFMVLMIMHERSNHICAHKHVSKGKMLFIFADSVIKNHKVNIINNQIPCIKSPLVKMFFMLTN